MDELAANATKENVGIVWYSGNDDALTSHWSTEVVIQVRIYPSSLLTYGAF
jgi:carboxypeptidase D